MGNVWHAGRLLTPLLDCQAAIHTSVGALPARFYACPLCVSHLSPACLRLTLGALCCMILHFVFSEYAFEHGNDTL